MIRNLFRKRKAKASSNEFNKKRLHPKIERSNNESNNTRFNNPKMTSRPKELDAETMEAVLELLSKPCRREVEELGSDGELSLTCKQDIQTVLSGYNHKAPYEPVPELPEDPPIVKHQTSIATAAAAVVLCFVLFRCISFWRMALRKNKKPVPQSTAAVSNKTKHRKQTSSKNNSKKAK